jgi:hypothetical protein
MASLNRNPPAGGSKRKCQIYMANVKTFLKLKVVFLDLSFEL